MANEFIIRKGYKSLASSEITGSLSITGSNISLAGADTPFLSIEDTTNDLTGKIRVANSYVYIEADQNNSVGSTRLVLKTDGTQFLYGDANQNVFIPTGNVGIGTTTASHMLTVQGAVSASAYYGDGSNLSGISVSTPTLDQVTDQGATTDNLITLTRNAEQLRMNTADANGPFASFKKNGTNIGFIGSGYHLWSSPNNNSDNIGFRGENQIDFGIGASVKMTINSSGNATFAGDVSIGPKNNATVQVSESGGATVKMLAGSVGRVGTYSNSDFILTTNSQNALTLDTSQNATFAGTVKAATTFIADAVDTGNPTPSENNVRVSGYGMIGNRGNLYITNANTASTAKVQIGIGGAHNDSPRLVIGTGDSTFYTNILPSSDSAFNIGSSGVRFANIYADTLYGDGSNLTGTIGLATSASHANNANNATNLNAIDDRDMAPEDYGYSNDLRIFFSTKEGLEAGSGTGTNYQDVLYLNSYADSSGGDANILAFDKSEKKIYHYQADQAATNWGTAKQLAYIDSTVANATTASHALTALYSGLQGTVPTWNQDTTGTAATASYVAAANIDGAVASATNADTVDSKHATDFTLDYVTDNGSSTSNGITVGDTIIRDSGVPTLTLDDNGNAGGGGASGKIIFNNTDGKAIGLGYTADVTSTSDFLISTDASSTYGGYLGLDAAAIDDPSSIILDPKTEVVVTKDLLVTGDLTVSGGDFTLGGTGRIQGIDTVTDGTDAVNKTYVDNAISGITEQDTLDTVVERGSTTDNNITVNSLFTNTDSTYTIGANGTRFLHGYFDNLHVKDEIRNNSAAYIDYISNQGHRFYIDGNNDDTAHMFQILANTDSYAAGNVLLTLQQDGKLIFGSDLDTNLYRSAANTLKTDDIFLAAGNIQTNGFFQVNSTSTLLRKYVSGWNSGVQSHDILYNGWNAGVSDYIYLKAAGNSTGGHGIILAADNGTYLGTTDVETGAITDSATAPLTNTWAYFRDATAYIKGDTSFAGDVTVAGTLTAQEFHTEFVSASIIYESGSTKFGDTSDDNHDFTGSVNIDGTLTATVKSFDIVHPTQEGKRLIYGVLEGPEHAVYVRGESKADTVILPEEWVGLVDETSITAQFTPIGKPDIYYYEGYENNTVKVGGPQEKNYFYYIQATRKDVEPLITVQ